MFNWKVACGWIIENTPEENKTTRKHKMVQIPDQARPAEPVQLGTFVPRDPGDASPLFLPCSDSVANNYHIMYNSWEGYRRNE